MDKDWLQGEKIHRFLFCARDSDHPLDDPALEVENEILVVDSTHDPACDQDAVDPAHDPARDQDAGVSDTGSKYNINAPTRYGGLPPVIDDP